MKEQYPVTSKILKKINDFNQIIKKYFEKYLVFTDGKVISDKSNQLLDMGFHFCISESKPLEFLIGEKIVELSSSSIFSLLKDRKKDIKFLTIENNQIYFETGQEELLMIGCIKEVDDIPQDVMYNYNKSSDVVKLSETKHKIDEDTIELLYDNNNVTLEVDDFKIRMTKELIPALKKGSNIEISFNNLYDDRLFQSTIIVNHDSIISYHQYTCVKF